MIIRWNAGRPQGNKQSVGSLTNPEPINPQWHIAGGFKPAWARNSNAILKVMTKL